MQRDQGRQHGRTDVFVEPTVASGPEVLPAKTTFHQDNMYYLSPFKLATMGSLPAFVLEEEDQGPYKYSLATTVERRDLHETSLAHTNTRTDLLRLFFLCTSSSLAHLEANQPQSRSRVLHRKRARTWVKLRVPCLLLPSGPDAQFGTPYPRSAGFDTDSRRRQICVHNGTLIKQ